MYILREKFENGTHNLLRKIQTGSPVMFFRPGVDMKNWIIDSPYPRTPEAEKNQPRSILLLAPVFATEKTERLMQTIT